MVGRRRKGLIKFSSSSDIVCSITIHRMSGLSYDTASGRAITSKASAAHHCNSWRFFNCICWHRMSAWCKFSILQDTLAQLRRCGGQLLFLQSAENWRWCNVGGQRHVAQDSTMVCSWEEGCDEGVMMTVRSDKAGVCVVINFHRSSPVMCLSVRP